MKRRAFTLIELLVVIAIVALLLSILFPLIEQGVSFARDAQCKSNLRNLAIAQKQYTADHGIHTFVWGNNDEGSPYEGIPWYALRWEHSLLPYTKDSPGDQFRVPNYEVLEKLMYEGVYRCPEIPADTPDPLDDSGTKTYRMSYSMNKWLSQENSKARNINVYRHSMWNPQLVQHPAKTLLYNRQP
ncbi:prepilin-type N-terminal cleavage/methylation domain-containing protein [Kiritimatiella glycovorans]|uniref:Type II secretion system protein G n=1 Tax=Kiritimatiella glycovorans TaxID=1307763 RepID=A0A0G3EEF9_9BACT|nr:prepilin-type N-terminal cleavage/methylation domain-containing protein [Kiritimatiella glycovorans]AKJ64728.1 hypothetical protein L21SP4_01483 [Kiritimatiella glycovorans]